MTNYKSRNAYDYVKNNVRVICPWIILNDTDFWPGRRFPSCVNMMLHNSEINIILSNTLIQ